MSMSGTHTRLQKTCSLRRPSTQNGSAFGTRRVPHISPILHVIILSEVYRGADKSLARTGSKQATATEDFDVHISYLRV